MPFAKTIWRQRTNLKDLHLILCFFENVGFLFQTVNLVWQKSNFLMRTQCESLTINGLKDEYVDHSTVVGALRKHK